MFVVDSDSVTWRGNGETLRVQAWGANSLRVRARMMGDILDTDDALLAPPPTHIEIEVDDHVAVIRNGNIHAVLRARHWEPIVGGGHQLTASFESDPAEKLYGMDQYQQQLMDLKGSVFELAHRNSQASVPFVLSSAGYGLFWHDPSIGSAGFGRNRTDYRFDEAFFPDPRAMIAELRSIKLCAPRRRQIRPGPDDLRGRRAHAPRAQFGIRPG